MIEFSGGEQIESIAVGDSQAWQINPSKRRDLLFVKPLSATASTNMTVVTDRHLYTFDLIARTDAKPLYVLKLSSGVLEDGSTAASDNHQNEIKTRNEPYAIVDPASLRFRWSASGDREILPKQIYDDGERTFLIWSEGQEQPALLTVDQKGSEAPLRFAAKERITVVDSVPSRIILRSGVMTAFLDRAQSAGPAGDDRVSTLGKRSNSSSR